MLIYLALNLLGLLERQFNLKPLRMNYIIVSEKTADELVAEVNAVLWKTRARNCRRMHSASLAQK